MAKKTTAAPRARPALSAQVRDVIASRGLTHTELGHLAGVDPTIIARFASGEREVRTGTLDRIAAAFHLRVVEDVPAGPRGRRAATPTR
jgi:transcriptional regulator with XRE-family HTH domain